MSPASKSFPHGKALDPAFQIRILIADNHPVVLEGLSALIDRQEDMVVVAQASNGLEAVKLWQKHRPDVTLLDLRMPDLDGFGTLGVIRQHDRFARVIVLTIHDNEESIYRALKAGAKGYLLKEISREALLESIRRVYAGETCVPDEIAAKMVKRLAGDTLSDREIAVLTLLAQGKSNRQIGVELSIGETTVKSHVKNIFAKLGVLSRTEAVTTAFSSGLIDL